MVVRITQQVHLEAVETAVVVLELMAQEQQHREQQTLEVAVVAQAGLEVVLMVA